MTQLRGRAGKVLTACTFVAAEGQAQKQGSVCVAAITPKSYLRKPAGVNWYLMSCHLTPLPHHATCSTYHSFADCRRSRCLAALGGAGASTPQTQWEWTASQWGATYQLVDAVDGPVVFVTQPLHTFKTEKGRREYECACYWAAMYPAFTDV